LLILIHIDEYQNHINHYLGKIKEIFGEAIKSITPDDIFDHLLGPKGDKRTTIKDEINKAIQVYKHKLETSSSNQNITYMAEFNKTPFVFPDAKTIAVMSELIGSSGSHTEDILSKIDKINNIITNTSLVNKIKSLASSVTGSDDLLLTNQMNRIQDARISATKMVLMHLVTGQSMKEEMVKDTLQLCDLLYTTTDLDLSDKTPNPSTTNPPTVPTP